MTELTFAAALSELTHCRSAMADVERALMRAGYRHDEVVQAKAHGRLFTLIDALVAKHRMDRDHAWALLDDRREACAKCEIRAMVDNL